MSSEPANSSEPKRRLWLVTELYYPEETSTGYYLTRIGEGLADRFDVKVICGQPTYFKRGTVAPKREVHKGVEIFRAAGTTLDKNIILFRLVNMITLGMAVFFKAVGNFRSGDRILVVTNPPLMPFIVAFASLIRGCGFVLLIHDNYPELAIAAKKMRAGSLLSRTIAIFNRWLYKYASKIIVVGRDMKELLERKTVGLDVPIAVIPNWAELETVEPAPKPENKLLRELGLSDKFVLLYAGNMGHPNDLESIVEAAGLLQGNDAIHFIFLGSGAKRPWLEQAVAQQQLQNVTILKPMPRSEQIVFLNACDVALVSLVAGMRGVSMPSRTYNALAAGKPILALSDDRSELEMVIKDDSVGWMVPPGNSKVLADTISRIYESKELLSEMGARARKAALDRYSLDLAMSRYSAELTDGPI